MVSGDPCTRELPEIRRTPAAAEIGGTSRSKMPTGAELTDQTRPVARGDLALEEPSGFEGLWAAEDIQTLGVGSQGARGIRRPRTPTPGGPCAPAGARTAVLGKQTVYYWAALQVTHTAPRGLVQGHPGDRRHSGVRSPAPRCGCTRFHSGSGTALTTSGRTPTG